MAESKEEIILQFNQDVLILIAELVNANPNNDFIYETQRRIKLISDVDSLILIREVGACLYRYKDQIRDLEAKNNAELFFINKDYDDEIKSSTNPTKASFARVLIPIIRTHTRSLDKERLNEYKKLVIKLLDNYIDYCAEYGFP